METESELYNNESDLDKENNHESWQGVPGLTDYERVSRVRADRISRMLGPDGAAITTRELTWAQLSETIFDEWRKAEIEKRLEDALRESEEKGEEISFEERINLRTQITNDVENLLGSSRELNVFSNTLKKYQNRLDIVTSDLPPTFKNINGVEGADSYILVQGGSREENDAQIFDNFKSLNNAGGNTKYDLIFYHSNGVTEGHGDDDFFGWKITVEGRTFVFIWNPDENDFDKQEDEKPVEDEKEVESNEDKDNS